MSTLRTLFVLSFFAALLCCTKNPTQSVAHPGGSEWEAKVVGQIQYPGGKPASNATVRIRSGDYLQDTAAKVLAKSMVRYANLSTDNTGHFMVNDVDTGNYTVEVNDNKGHAVFIRCHVVHDSVVLLDSLLPTGAVEGTWSNLILDTLAGFVQVYGLERAASIDSRSKKFVLSDMPAGMFSLRFVSASLGISPNVVDSVLLTPAQVLSRAFSPLKLSKKITLNTTPAGADVSSMVTNFPVLVRLTKNNFDFAQAKNDGSDLRFTRVPSAVLPYEIERWDSTLQQAEVWVKVDTVFGNDSNQFVTMYWGALASSETAFLSNSAAVFDTANGFDGTWHLDKSSADATPNKNNGVTYGATDTVGIIGNAKKFRGTDSIKIAGLMGKPKSVTLSAWANLDSAQGPGSDVISIGNFVLIRMDDSYQGRGTQGSFCVDGDTVFSVLSSGKNFAKTGWHYFAYSYDAIAASQSLYIDGVLFGTNNNASPINYGTTGTATFIGRRGAGLARGFVGLIDEARVCKTVRSANWIKLCFMNQQVNDLLVDFK